MLKLLEFQKFLTFSDTEVSPSQTRNASRHRLLFLRVVSMPSSSVWAWQGSARCRKQGTTLKCQSRISQSNEAWNVKLSLYSSFQTAPMTCLTKLFDFVRRLSVGLGLAACQAMIASGTYSCEVWGWFWAVKGIEIGSYICVSFCVTEVKFFRNFRTDSKFERIWSFWTRQASFCHTCGPLAGQCDQYCGYGLCAVSWSSQWNGKF